MKCLFKRMSFLLMLKFTHCIFKVSQPAKMANSRQEVQTLTSIKIGVFVQIFISSGTVIVMLLFDFIKFTKMSAPYNHLPIRMLIFFECLLEKKKVFHSVSR